MKSEGIAKQSGLLAISSFIVNEILSRHEIGTAFSVALFLFLAVYILTAGRATFAAIFVTCFLVQEFPRDILLDYSNYTYNTIKTVKVGPSTLFLYLAILAILTTLYYHISLRLLAAFFAVNALVLSTTLVSTASGAEISASLIATNYKLIIFCFLGVAFGYQFLRWRGAEGAIEALIKLVLVCSLAAAIRAYLNLGYEIYNGNIFVFELGTEPLYLFAALLYSVQGSWPLYAYAGFFTTSRAEIIFLATGLLVANIRSILGARPSRLILSALVACCLVYAVAQTVPFLFDFFLWKVSEIEIFGGEPSGSSLVRRHELLNIVCIAAENPVRLFFGSGLSALYNFDCFPLPSGVLLEEKSFSDDQIASNKYYGVHTTPSAILLRYGVLGLALVIAISLLSSIRIMNTRATAGKKAALLLILLFSIYYFHSQSQAQITFGFLVVVLLMARKAEEEPANCNAVGALTPSAGH